jgi:antirestriction protein ArdC
MSRDIYETITARFIEQLKSGTVPWQRPWLSAQNIVSQKPYRGINSLLLGLSPHESPFWISFKQALDLGGHVRKGEKSTPVIYYKFLEKRDGSGNLVMRADGSQARVPFIRWSNVFNLDQTEGITPPTLTVAPTDRLPCEKAAAMVASTNVCPIRHVGFSAAYLPHLDEIHMPSPAAFRRPEEYHHTLFHEMTHATGHGSRLDREGVTNPARFGSERYSREELVAELGAAFLSNEAGILNEMTFQNSAAYLASWAKKLEDDPRLIVSAASQAQRSSDFIMGVQQVENLSEQEPVFAVEETGAGLPEAIAPALALKTGSGSPVESVGVGARTWSGRTGVKPPSRIRKGGMSL